MSGIATMNNQLHRTLKKGNQYNKYFSNVKCKEVFLGSGKTTFGLHKMKEWTDLHFKQTEKIAKVLKANSLEQTVLNIKQFLYDHLQYDADGFNQNLRSPNCSWVSRKQGIDCKSYSTFGGSILKVLKIPFSYRKITQPSSPEDWSHVYVVVKDKNGKELIIDGTVPFNYEVPKVKQEDLKMEQSLPYFGLNAAQGLNAAKKEQIETVSNFRKFLRELNSKGASISVTRNIENEVRKYTDANLDPKIQLSPNYIIIGTTRIDYNFGLNDGLGVVFSAAAVTAAASKINWGKALGSLTSLFGGGTSLEEMNKHSGREIKAAVDKFESGFQSNPSQALTTLNKDIHYLVGQTTLGLENASSSNSKSSGKKNLDEAKQFLANFINIENDVAKSYHISKSSASGSVFFKRREDFTYTVYKLTPKTANSNAAISIGLPNSLDSNPLTTTESKGNQFINSLVRLGEDLFSNPQTGQTYTAAQVQQAKTQIQSAQGNVSSAGMSTTTKVAIGVAAAATVGGIAYAVLKK